MRNFKEIEHWIKRVKNEVSMYTLQHGKRVHQENSRKWNKVTSPSGGRKMKGERWRRERKQMHAGWMYNCTCICGRVSILGFQRISLFPVLECLQCSYSFTHYSFNYSLEFINAWINIVLSQADLQLGDLLADEIVFYHYAMKSTLCHQ